MSLPPRRLLAARPSPVPLHAHEASPGLHRVDLGGARPAWVQVPASWSPDRPAACAVMLHGSGGDPAQGLSLLEPFAQEAGLIVAAPASTDYTWDRVLGDYGADMPCIDALLGWVFERYAIDPHRLALGGFSDGASHALSLGLDNGDLFPKLLALSPGFAGPQAPQGKPRVFVSHGTRDRVLPIERCSRRVVPALQRAGYDVQYLEFIGSHEIPPDVAREAVRAVER